jgi:hypothetical protein
MKNYFKSKKIRRLKWAALLPLLFLIGGVAYAVLTSTPDTLTGNTIETASANLLLSADGINYGTTYPGFDFNGVVPGGSSAPVAGYAFYLKNTGGVSLVPKLSIAKQPANPNDVSLDKVNILVTTVASGNAAQSFTFQSLLSGAQVLGIASLASGQSQQYKLQVSMAPDAMTGNSASLSGIDLVISGTTGG